MQKANKAKYELTHSNDKLNSIIAEVHYKWRRKSNRCTSMKLTNDSIKQTERTSRLIRVKKEIEDEPRLVQALPRDNLKLETRLEHNI